MNIKIEINSKDHKQVTVGELVVALNELVGSGNLFHGEYFDKIYWKPCSNNQIHNTVIALISLWFAEDESDSRGFTRFGGFSCGKNGDGAASYFSVKQPFELYQFVLKLNQARKVKFDIV